MSLSTQRRDELKNGYLDATKQVKGDDLELIKNLFKEIGFLEKALIEREEALKKQKEESDSSIKETKTVEELSAFAERKSKELKEEQRRLEERNNWEFYEESISLATTLIWMNHNKPFNEDTKKEFGLLSDSIKFTTKVMQSQCKPEDLEDAIKLGEEIKKNKEHYKSGKGASIEKKQRWQKFAIAFGVVLIIAGITALLSALTLGFAAMPIGVALGVGMALYFGGTLSGAAVTGYGVVKHMNLSTEKENLVKPRKRFHHFHKEVVKKAKESSGPDSEPGTAKKL